MPLPTEYQEHYDLHAEVIEQRLREFAGVPSTEYIYELLYCLLTPQSRAVHAGRVVHELRELDFVEHPFDPTSHLRDPSHYIRFHNQKAKRLLAVVEGRDAIMRMLLSDTSSSAKREWLVRGINGLGWKEASHFLRNIGHLDLAIIDRHILKHMLRCGAIDELPRSIGTRGVYLDLEQRFTALAQEVGLGLQQLDLLFWSYEEGSVRK